MIPCGHGLVLINGLQVLDYAVHILDLVRNDKLHPWKTSVAYEMFWGGGSTMSDIHSALFLGVYAL